MPTRPWLETPQEYGALLKPVVAAVSREHDLESLCRELPSRAQQVKDGKGARLGK